MAIVFGMVRTNWSGTTGGPGLTQMAVQGITDPHTWNAAAAQRAVDAVRKAWFACVAYIPDNIKLDVQPVVDVYSSLDGELVGSYAAATTPAQVTGTATTSFSMANGLKVNLNTGAIRNGRRVRGSVFIVPAAIGAFTTDGLVAAATRTAINAAFQQINTDLLATNEQVAVWSRPLPEGHPKYPRPGALTAVTSFETSEKGAVLRGRRD